MQVYTFSTKNRLVAALAALVVLGAGAALLLVGLALLAGLAVAGGIIGSGVIAYRALRGKPPTPIRGSSSPLDPSLEVFPDSRRIEFDAPHEDPHRIEPT